MKYFLLLFSVSFYGQIIHHQMFSAQGMTKKMTNGYTISHTIGQQSTTGNSYKDAIVIQGFQQSYWGGYIAENEKSKITTITYPNPFTDVVNFQFSAPINEEISIYVFDITGRLVYQQKKFSDNSIVTISLSKLPRSEYLVQLKSNTITHYNKIIKL